MTYTIKTPHFEGPFDLLLFFIERDELDIYDIPITLITDNFFEYMREMERLNIDLASDFILVAATLMRIKAKMLIPRKQLDEEGNEIDPREELVQHLIEYKRYKSVIEELRMMEDKRSRMAVRGNTGEELKLLAQHALIDIDLESMTLYNLMSAFKRVMEDFNREQNREVHTIMTYSYTIQNQQDVIFGKFKFSKKQSFDSIFSECENRIHAIVTFLALLELLNQQLLKLKNSNGVNSFELEIREKVDEEE